MRRPLTILPFLLLAMAVGCGSNGADPPPPSAEIEQWAFRVEAPHDVSAAVFQVAGMASVSFDDGEAFVRERAGTTYLVLIRYTPGELRFRLGEATPGAQPIVTLLEIADEDDDVAPSLDDYDVRIDG